MTNRELNNKVLGTVSDHLYDGVAAIIDNARMQVAIYVNTQTCMTFWNVGKYIIDDMDYQTYSAYGKKILETKAMQALVNSLKQPNTISPATTQYNPNVLRLDNDNDAELWLTITLK